MRNTKLPEVIASEYVVLDVETNGLSSLRDDLLSITIFQPDTNMMFNRFLPLELNRDVYTTHINGIDKKDLINATPLTQEDVDNLILEFDLENRTILTYGNIDEKFMKKYFERKRLDGFQKLHFFNFKRNIISSRFSGGNVTKDNLCNIYGIENVQEKHTGANDCLLEWELFRRMDNQKLLVTYDKVYEFTEEYVIPISYLSTYPNFKYHITNLPCISFSSEEIERFEIVGKNLKKFPTNFNGLLVEHLINSMLSAEKVDSSDYLTENKNKLKYIGKLPSAFYEVLMDFRSDGTVHAVFEKDKKAEEVLNSFILSLKQEISPLITYIAQNVFGGEKIYSQELVVHQEENVLALCDLSSKSTVLEIKTCENLDINKFKEQLFYQAKGRACYALQIDWRERPKRISFIISKVDFAICTATALESRAKKYYKKVLDRSNGIIAISEYVGSKDNVTAKCSNCDHVWIIKADKLLARPYCPECRHGSKKNFEKRETSKSTMSANKNKKLRAQKYCTKISDKSKKSIKVVKYLGSKDNVIAQCLKCGHEWSIRADHLISRTYCPVCKRNAK